MVPRTLTPLIRNISAVVIGSNSMEYKPIGFRIIHRIHEIHWAFYVLIFINGVNPPPKEFFYNSPIKIFKETC